MDRWLKIQKLFQRGILNWDEALNALCEADCEVDATELIGTRAEYEQAMAAIAWERSDLASSFGW